MIKMSVRELVEKLAAANASTLEGYRDGNSDVYKKVFTDASSRTVTNDWSTVCTMPWGHVYVIYGKVDSDKCNVCIGITKFENVKEYQEAVIGEIKFEIQEMNKGR